MEMDWMALQAAQAGTAAAAARPASNSREDEAAGRDSFRDLLRQKQDETPADEPAAAEPAPEEAREIPDQQQALAAALVIQAAIIPVEDPAVLQTAPATAETAAAPVMELQAAPAAAPQRGAQPSEPVTPETERAEAAPAAEGAAERPASGRPAAGKEEEVPELSEPRRGPCTAEARPDRRPEDRSGGQEVRGEEFGPLFREKSDFVVKVAEPEPQMLDTQAPDLEAQLAGRVEQARENGWQHVEIKLEPEHLGTLVLTLDKSLDGTLRVTLHTANEKTASLLSEHTTGLTALLQGGDRSQPVTVEVQRQQENQQAQYQQQYQDQGGGQREQRQRQERRQPENDRQDFIQQLRLGLVTFDGAAS